MEPASLDRLLRCCGAEAGELAAAVPDGCYLVRAELGWIAGRNAEGSRLRAADLARAVDGPPIDALLADARAAARRRGWLAIHRDEEARRDVLRRHDDGPRRAARFLRMWPDRLGYPDGACPVLRLDLETGCAWHVVEPELASRAIGALVRRRWGLDGTVRTLRFEQLFDLADPSETRIIRDAIELRVSSDPRATLAAHGLVPAADDERRLAVVEQSARGQLAITAELDGELLRVAVELDRAHRLR
jgi:hypothetical protein